MLTDVIDTWLAEDVPFPEIEQRIDSLDVHADVRSVLWLYAWCWQDRGAQRAVVAEMAAALQ